ncbi:hypothetical protein DTO021D3_1990 [Paecilomyces variotii]|nr:hypothetical protein DTO032I3_8802 [Paecilomyces variotii]KAJ9281331.1 hypothetical protein DTO021D3_1990 [Paecilomyces variotii]KAJ9344995.1 hypothetical protein DTO027B6_2701 [Paecilomyces variotii]KAJ9375523.1 hypothetical protein DTO032I4_9013 [Paecilomyces variotii]
MSLTNAYLAEPAFPILASSLISEPFPGEAKRASGKVVNNASPRGDSHPSREWSLKHDIKNGIGSDKDSVFRCGTITGFSRLREGNADEDKGRVGELPRYLLSTHLRRTSPNHPSEPRAFIIRSPTSSAFSPETLLGSLLSCHDEPHLSREEAVELLDSVQILSVLDFTHVIQAISNVSDALNRIQQQRHQLRENHGQVSSSDNCNSPVLLIIEGIDTMADGLIRTSSPLRGTALLVPVLRTLTYLSRTYASFLSVMLVNTNTLGSIYPNRSVNPSSRSSGQGQQFNVGDGDGDRNEGIHSVFLHRATSTTLLPTILSRSLDQGIDAHLLLSKVNGRTVVEVVKDRVGSGVGRWCVWDRGTWEALAAPLD